MSAGSRRGGSRSEIELGEPEVIIEEDESPVILTAPDTLPFLLEIETLHIASVGVELAKNEIFSVRMHIWKLTVDGKVDGDLIFYILDPNNRRIFDAGRIEGEYEFTLTPEKSGVYIMNFIDDRGHRIVELHHNYEGTF